MTGRSLAAAAFQPAAGHRDQRIRSKQHPAGAGISERPFTRSQQRDCHHYEVNVPGLRLQFHAEDLCETVRCPTPSLRSISRPMRGVIKARHPFFAPIYGAPAIFPVPTPLRAVSGPPDQSVQPARFTGSSSPDPSDRHSPLFAAVSFDSALYRRGELATFRSTNRSVNPGTESIMNRPRRFRQTEKPLFPRLSSAFFNHSIQSLGTLLR